MTRVADVLEFLVAAERLCLEAETQRDEILITQSAVAMELLGWHELVDDLDLAIAHAHKLVLSFHEPE